jgi:uncharacterized protein (DUF58 family)
MAKMLFDSEFLSQLEQLRMSFKAKAQGQSGGGRRSRQLGVSAEFSDFREYLPGDDFRRVDWNAYARFDRLMLKLFLEERQMRVHLLIDDSESMQMFRKSMMAKRLALTIGYIALANYDQVSISVLGEGEAKSFGPVSGKNEFLRMAAFLGDLSPKKKSPLTESVRSLDLSGGPGVCWLFTDAFSQDGVEDALKYLSYRKKETTLVHILAPEELEPAYEGSLRLVDSETGEHREMEISPSLMKSYKEALNSFCASLKETCHSHGFNYELIPSSMDLRQAVLEHLI